MTKVMMMDHVFPNGISIEQVFQTLFLSDGFVRHFLSKHLLPSDMIHDLNVGPWVHKNTLLPITVKKSVFDYVKEPLEWLRNISFKAKVNAPRILNVPPVLSVSVKENCTIMNNTSFAVKSVIELDRNEFSYADAFDIYLEWKVIQVIDSEKRNDGSTNNVKLVRLSMGGNAAFSNKWIPMVQSTLQNYIHNKKRKWIALASVAMGQESQQLIECSPRRKSILSIKAFSIFKKIKNKVIKTSTNNTLRRRNPSVEAPLLNVTAATCMGQGSNSKIEGILIILYILFYPVVYVYGIIYWGMVDSLSK